MSLHHAHEHGHDHGHHHYGHSHAPATFGTAFAIATVLNIALVTVQVAYGVLANVCYTFGFGIESERQSRLPGGLSSAFPGYDALRFRFATEHRNGSSPMR